MFAKKMYAALPYLAHNLLIQDSTRKETKMAVAILAKIEKFPENL